MSDNPRNQDFIAFARQLATAAGRQRHRRLLVLAGEPGWCRRLAAALVDATPLIDETGATDRGQILWVGDSGAGSAIRLKASQSNRYLGTESSLIIFDAFDGFNPDGLAAISGTLRAGGLMLLLTPPLDHWPDYPDPEYRRLLVHPLQPESAKGYFLTLIARALRTDREVSILQQGEAVPPVPVRSVVDSGPAVPSVSDADSACRTEDQALAVAALLRVVSGHRRRPLVITADRGRGKSAALGIAAARSLQQGPRTVLITAPTMDAVMTAFDIAGRLLEGEVVSRSELKCNGGRLKYLPPDELLRLNPDADLLLVDEAAAVPAPMLEALLRRYSRIAFSTTVHGYEGSGRGFQVRFQQTLARLTPGWRSLRMTEPVRWAQQDPLERWVFRALMLDAEVDTPDLEKGLIPEHCQSEELTPAQLLADSGRLQQLFALLVQAHYRTTPGDLRDLLDGSNLRIRVLSYQGLIVAALLVAHEGGFDSAMAEAIWSGHRRPRGHLLPQILAGQGGWLQASELRYWRIVRIAVVPQFQQQGLGRRLLRELREAAQTAPVDLLGSSFSASPELLRFWSACGYQPMRLGLSRDASSGAHSALVGIAVSEPARQLRQQAGLRFRHQFIDWLRGPLAQLEPAIVCWLLRHLPAAGQAELSEQDQLDLIAFGWGRRGFEQSWSSLQKLVLQYRVTVDGDSDPAQRSLLVARVLQERDWQHCAALLSLPGRRQVESLLRQQVRELLPTTPLTPMAGRLLAQLQDNEDKK